MNKVFIVSIVGVILFSLLSVGMVTDNLSFLDDTAYIYLNSFNTDFTKVSMFIGKFFAIEMMSIVCLILLIIPKTRNSAIQIVFTIGVSSICNKVIKYLFSRERPDIQDMIVFHGYSFPSGHSMNNMAFFAIISIVIIKYSKNTILKVLCSILCYLTVIVIGISRVYLGAHYVSDVLSGFILGFCIAIVVSYLYENYIEEQIKKFGII